MSNVDMILAKDALSQWVESLAGAEIYSPVFADNQWNYEIIDDAGKIRLDHAMAVHPPKKVVFPQREVFFEFRVSRGKLPEFVEVMPAEKRTVVFGVRPCDGKSMLHLDRIFDDDFQDNFYVQRRNNTVLIGLACIVAPSRNCFCTSVNGSPAAEDGLDILMTDLGDRYFVRFITEKGKGLLEHAGALFEQAGDADLQSAGKAHEDAIAAMPRHIDNADEAPAKLKAGFHSPVWDQEAMRCIECGICTFLCPTCHCFDINDEVSATYPVKGKRVRTWDTCQYPDFTMHSSGHNPRADKASRLRQRVAHKFQYFVENYDQFLCTGCGRCITDCPVGIDIIDVVNKVRADV
jgi:ferredoxin